MHAQEEPVPAASGGEPESSSGTPAPHDGAPTVVVPIEIEHRSYSRMQAASLAVLACGAVLTLMYVAKPVLIVLLVSVLLAFALAPIVDFLQRFVHLPKSVGAFIAVLLLVALTYGLTYLSYNRAVGFLQQLPQYSGKIRETVMRFRQHAENIKKTTETVLPQDQEEKNAVTVRQTSNWTEALTQGAVNVTEVVLLAGFVPFLVYFMLSWQEHVRTATVMLFRMDHRHTAYVTLGMISAMIRSFIVGNLLVGVFSSIVSIIVFGVIGVPYFYFIGVISGFLTLVPYLGIVLAMLPPIAAGLGIIHTEQFVMIVCTIIALHLFALNVLYPKLIGRRTQLNPLAVTISLLFWGWLWGAMGLILAIPLTAALKIILDHVETLRPYGAWLGE